MSDILGRLTATSLGQWVLTSTYGYPVLLVFHSIGLALLVGIFALVDFRILGFGVAVPLRALQRLLPIAWGGFCISLTSGSLLFIADGAKFYNSFVFKVKFVSIVMGTILSFLIRLSVFSPATGSSARFSVAPMQARVLAICSLLAWFGTIMAGRLMAYIN